MLYTSTRKTEKKIPISEAIVEGLAWDGGLFVPEKFPSFQFEEFGQGCTIPQIAARLLDPWFEGDSLHNGLSEISQNAFNFPIPLNWMGEDSALLELFHGPTAAFKDVGAQFLAECISRIPFNSKRIVLVATSGDTGGAVASAFYKKPNIEVVILFPKGKVSQRQEKQLTSWGDNVRAFSVLGDFDDCQRLVKEAFSAEKLKSERRLFSANSINIGRLLPQSVYYASASLEFWKQKKIKPGIIIPSGNLGNAVAALWAKKMGFPIREIVLATNCNPSITEYFRTGVWIPHPTVSTLANAMDVGNPSNMERLLHLYPDFQKLKSEVQVVAVTDFDISKTIQQGVKRWNQVFCPHTATGVFAREALGGTNWIVVATAHPAKFESIVEPLIGKTVPIPEALSAILKRKASVTDLLPQLPDLEKVLS
jgi:threonine synthase